jgi:ribose transport system substrate-binding protein
MASVLAAHPHLQGVYCENDPEAEGASQELLSAGKNPMTSPVLVGFNGDPPALTLLKEHKLAADVAQNPYQEGIRAVEAAYDLLNNKPVPYTNKGGKEIEIPVQLVTPGNVAKFIAGLKTGQLY